MKSVIKIRKVSNVFHEFRRLVKFIKLYKTKTYNTTNTDFDETILRLNVNNKRNKCIQEKQNKSETTKMIYILTPFPIQIYIHMYVLRMRIS